MDIIVILYFIKIRLNIGLFFSDIFNVKNRKKKLSKFTKHIWREKSVY